MFPVSFRLVTCVALAGLLRCAPAIATDGVVGPANCNETGFVSVLNTVMSSGGGAISFNCGASPTTITFTSYQAITSPVTINGANLIIFDGNNASAFFQNSTGVNTTLNGLTFKRGIFSNVHPLENFGTLTINGCTVTQNISSDSAITNSGTLIIRNSTLSGNSINAGSPRRGAVLFNSGAARIETSTITGNTITGGTGQGGAIYTDSTDLTVVGSTFSSNSALDGSAIYVAVGASATISGSTFSANSGGYGGAIETSGTLVRVKTSTFSGNTVTGDGGAIWVLGGALNVDRSQFVNNTSGTTGGAISCYDTSLTVTNSAFGSNHSGSTGGAIYSTCGLLVTNATFNANSTTGANGGGAIYHSGTQSGLVSYATINANTAMFGAGVYKDGAAGGTLFVARSIVSANPGGNCDGVVGSNGYNVVNDTGCGGFTATGDAQNANVPLGAFANNGGPTSTQIPTAGNVAIDRIPNAQCFNATDQRGAVRPAGAGCDSGAYEVGALFDRIFFDGFDI